MNKRECIVYDELEKETFDYLDKNKHIVLATCLNNEPTARTVSYIIIDNKIYFQTDIKFDKCMQMEGNENVALCLDNYQIEGTAKILEHPFNEKNNKFLEKFKQVHKKSFNEYSDLEDEVVIEIKPIFIKIWKYINNKPYIEYLNITDRVATRESYR
ncbi:MAG: pyridoxamine 5'-phosphate oxidase family protein [Clostridia bacterium]